VILPDDFYLPGLTDSKKLSAKKREILYAQITKQCQWALGESSASEIDNINILQATMTICLSRLTFATIEAAEIAGSIKSPLTIAMQLLNAGQRLPVGNVVAGAVILPDDFYLPGLTDSKKLSTKKREILYAQITKQCQWALVTQRWATITIYQYLVKLHIERLNCSLHCQHRGLQNINVIDFTCT
jgi:ribonuclease HII